MAVLVIINNVGMSINPGVNVKNWLIKVYVIKDVFEILIIMSANLINHVILVSNYTMKTVYVEKSKLINRLSALPLKNVLKMLKEVKIAKITSTELHSPENENKHKCSSCTVYIALISVIFTVNVGMLFH